MNHFCCPSIEFGASILCGRRGNLFRFCLSILTEFHRTGDLERQAVHSRPWSIDILLNPTHGKKEGKAVRAGRWRASPVQFRWIWLKAVSSGLVRWWLSHEKRSRAISASDCVLLQHLEAPLCWGRIWCNRPVHYLHTHTRTLTHMHVLSVSHFILFSKKGGHWLYTWSFVKICNHHFIKSYKTSKHPQSCVNDRQRIYFPPNYVFAWHGQTKGDSSIWKGNSNRRNSGESLKFLHFWVNSLQDAWLITWQSSSLAKGLKLYLFCLPKKNDYLRLKILDVFCSSNYGGSISQSTTQDMPKNKFDALLRA